MHKLNETHDAKRTSWVESANTETTDFPIQNLPLGVFSVGDSEPRIGTAIGDMILDLTGAASAGLFDSCGEEAAGALDWYCLNMLMWETPDTWSAVRARTSELLEASNPELRDNDELRQNLLVPMSEATLHEPVDIGDYTDFYASVHHATNVGSMFRPDNPLLPNYKNLPVGYHGRASSVVLSGTPIRRPMGQTLPAGEEQPTFGPCKLLDYELEVGAYIGGGNQLGERITIDQAHNYIFGLTLLNDWSARDIQKWEYQPLGPFGAKNFATSVSPWVVTSEALAPFRCAAETRQADDPAVLDYLIGDEDQAAGGYDITLQVLIRTEQMRERNMPAHVISAGSFSRMYWTIAQMLTHHTVTGCNMQAGDLIASGTVSGPERESRGCLLELTWDGDANNPLPGTQRTPIKLPSGEQRTFLQDGDEVIIRGYCEKPGKRRIGLGECKGTVTSAS